MDVAEKQFTFFLQNVSIEVHFNHMPNVLPVEQPGPYSFYMYSNTGCDKKLKYSNNVFICRGLKIACEMLTVHKQQ